MDGYVDVTELSAVCWECLQERLQPNGLLGQTWNATAPMWHSDEQVAEYREAQDQLLGCQRQHDRFCQAAQHPQPQRAKGESDAYRRVEDPERSRGVGEAGERPDGSAE